jgi:transposase-like protein
MMAKTLLMVWGLMAGSKASSRRGSRRSLVEKRRLVELTLREGASIRSVAREHGVNRNSLYQWLALYRVGQLNVKGSGQRADTAAPKATLLPVTIVRTRGRPQTAGDRNSNAASIVELMFASGTALRIETGSLDAALIAALVAELQKSA